MAAGNSQKLKVLHLMDILQKETDQTHGLTMPQIIERLEERGVSAERKSVYADIATLREFGLDVCKLSRQPVEYALADREFDLPELMLLVDAVQSSRFLSEGKSKSLVKSIKQLASAGERGALNKQVHVHGRPRRQEQSDFNAVDVIQHAMGSHCKISFKYFMYNAAKERVARKGGAVHVCSPVSVSYSDGNYYLAAFSDADQEIRNYRVDRMGAIRILDEKAQKNEQIRAYDPAEVGACAFGMYAGVRKMVTLRVSTDVMNVVIDRFGKDVLCTPVDDGAAALVQAPVMVSPVFFGWLAQLGRAAQIEKPTDVRQQFLDYLAEIVKAYG